MDTTNNVPKDNLTTALNVRGVQESRFVCRKLSFSNPNLEFRIWVKMLIIIPYVTSTGHHQSFSKWWFGYYLKCMRSSVNNVSKKKSFLWCWVYSDPQQNSSLRQESNSKSECWIQNWLQVCQFLIWNNQNYVKGTLCPANTPVYIYQTHTWTSIHVCAIYTYNHDIH